MENFNNRDGRGRSPGSRSSQFSKDRQPDRSAMRKAKIDPQPAEMLHKAIYEKVAASHGRRKVKIPFIEGLIRSMRNNALKATVTEQLKYFNLLQKAGIFEVEEYKESLFRRINNYYKKVMKSYKELDDFIVELANEYKRVTAAYLLHLNAFMIARGRCTCGACEHALDDAGSMLLEGMRQILVSTEDDDWEDEQPEGPSASVSGVLPDEAAPTPSPRDDDPDDEFYSGMGWD